MSLITIVITLIVVGVLLWLVNTYIPMDGKIKKVLNIVVMVVVVLWLLNVFGVWGHLRRRSGHHADTVPGRADLLCHLADLSADIHLVEANRRERYDYDANSGSCGTGNAGFSNVGRCHGDL